MAEAGPQVMRGLLEAFVLDSLVVAPKHGYALLKEMEDVFGEEPNRNRIYPLLQRLEAEGLVRAVEDATDTRGRVRYEITDLGRETLAAYRRLPRAFRDALERVWGVKTAPLQESAPLTAAPALAPPGAPAEPLAAATLPLASAVPSPAAGTLPYPCPEAAVAVRKEPRSGRLTLELTGCPMGAYEYCPLCPVAKGVRQLDGLVYGLR